MRHHAAGKQLLLLFPIVAPQRDLQLYISRLERLDQLARGRPAQLLERNAGEAVARGQLLDEPDGVELWETRRLVGREFLDPGVGGRRQRGEPLEHFEEVVPDAEEAGVELEEDLGGYQRLAHSPVDDPKKKKSKCRYRRKKDDTRIAKNRTEMREKGMQRRQGRENLSPYLQLLQAPRQHLPHALPRFLAPAKPLVHLVANGLRVRAPREPQSRRDAHLSQLPERAEVGPRAVRPRPLVAVVDEAELLQRVPHGVERARDGRGTQAAGVERNARVSRVAAARQRGGQAAQVRGVLEDAVQDRERDAEDAQVQVAQAGREGEGQGREVGERGPGLQGWFGDIAEAGCGDGFDGRHEH